MATTKPLDLLSFWPSSFRIVFLSGLSLLIFGTVNAFGAQEQPQPSNLSSGVKTLAPARRKHAANWSENSSFPFSCKSANYFYAAVRIIQTCAVQGRIAGVKDYLANLPVAPPNSASIERLATPLPNPEEHNGSARKSPSSGTGFERTGLSSKLAGPGDISFAGYSVPAKLQPHDREEVSRPTGAKHLRSSTSFPSKTGEELPNQTKLADPLQSIASKYDAKTPSSDSNATKLPKSKVLEKKPEPFIWEQPPSFPAMAKRMLTKEEPESSGYFLKISGRQFVIFFVALLVCLFAHLAAFCLILRCYAPQISSSSFQPIVHRQPGLSSPDSSPIDCNSADIQGFPQTLGGLNLEKPSFDVSAAASLGPTWAEELQKKEEEEARKGEAIFQHLFKQNLELKNQLFVTGEASQISVHPPTELAFAGVAPSGGVMGSRERGGDSEGKGRFTWIRKSFILGWILGLSKHPLPPRPVPARSSSSAVGRPKDQIARTLLGRDVVFGKDLVDHRLALDIIRPFETGALKYNSHTDVGLAQNKIEAHKQAARLLVEYAVALTRPTKGCLIYGVIGAPSRASVANKQVILESAHAIFDAVMIVSEPFSIAYGMNRLSDTLVVDIGAGTIDLCPIYGTFPTEQDQVTLPLGGDAIDDCFHQELRKTYPEAQVSLNMAREIKEKYGFVHDVNEKAVVTLPVKGKPQSFDVTGPT